MRQHWTHFTRNKAERYVAARVQRRRNRLQEVFPLHKYKTWKRAERAAERWLRKIIPKLPLAISSKNRMTRRNTSGVVGVHPHYHRIRQRRKTYEYFNWVSRWPGCKFSGGVRWSINKYGEDDAWILAVLCRRMENEDREAVMRSALRLSNKAREKILDLRNAI